MAFDKIEDRQAEITALFEELSNPDWNKSSASAPAKITRMADDSPLTRDDVALTARAQAAKDGEAFQRLMGGAWADYPSQSEADQALCNKLAFWTGKDPARMDRIFRSSGLMRPKWDVVHVQGQTYGTVTIQKALNGTMETYKPKARTKMKAKPQAKPKAQATENAQKDAEAVEANEEVIAAEFSAEHKDHLRFCGEWGAWLEWDRQRHVWKKDRTRKAFHYARLVCKRMNPNGKATLGKASTAGGVEKFARADPGLATTSEQWDVDPMMLGTPSGVKHLN